MNNNFGTVSEAGILHMERVLPASIECVWTYLVKPEMRARWLASGTMSTTPGSKFELHFDHIQLSGEIAPERFSACNESIIETSRLIHLEPPRRLTMTWDEGGPAASEVSFELVEQDKQTTRLILTHRRLPDHKQRLIHACGWHAHLDLLDDHLHTRPPRPYWTRFIALETLYEQRIPA